MDVMQLRRNLLMKKKSKNLFDKNTIVRVDGKNIGYSGEIQTIASNGYLENYYPVKKNTYYTLTGSGSRIIAIYDSEKNFISRGGGNNPPQSVLIPNSGAYVRFCYRLSDVDFSTWQFEEGWSATSYEPYYY